MLISVRAAGVLAFCATRVNNGGRLSMKTPTFTYERQLIAEGYCAIVGIDEVGYGALAGPVVAGAVILPLKSRLGGIRDSKLLTPLQRDRLFSQIQEKAHAWSVGIAHVDEINRLGLKPATFLAMRRALSDIPIFDHVLIDAFSIPNHHIPQTPVVKGDQLVKSIAAASIMAKVYRDRMMKALHNEYRDYGFDAHKGYGTEKHLTAIKTIGPSPVHRINYKIFSSLSSRV